MRGASSETRRRAPGQIAREAVRGVAKDALPPALDVRSRTFAMAALEHDFRLVELLLATATAAVRAAGHDPENPVIAAEIVQGALRGWEEREAIDRYQADRDWENIARREGLRGNLADLGLSCRRDRGVWFRYRRSPRPLHGSRHRRAPGHRPVRRRGRYAARRSAGARAR